MVKMYCNNYTIGSNMYIKFKVKGGLNMHVDFNGVPVKNKFLKFLIAFLAIFLVLIILGLVFAIIFPVIVLSGAIVIGAIALALVIALICIPLGLIKGKGSKNLRDK